ncbi:MAG: PilN domain-containing protein [Patescibacteria group bacterium]
MKIDLNLIPPQKKEEIKQAIRFKIFLKWGLEFFVIFAIFIAMLVSINYMLELNLAFTSLSYAANTKNNNQYVEIEKYDAEIKEINIQILAIEKIQQGQLQWSNFFQKFNLHISTGVEVEKVATKNYTISLVGKAKTRDALISFKENLEKEECFAEINLPLSNLVSRENVDFQIDFKMKQECLK